MMNYVREGNYGFDRAFHGGGFGFVMSVFVVVLVILLIVWLVKEISK